MSVRDYSRLKELLEKGETFPLDFMHKFIGRNTEAFEKSVREFEKLFPKAIKQSARTSKGDAHLALTYTFRADNADEIVMLIDSTYQITDVLIVL